MTLRRFATGAGLCLLTLLLATRGIDADVYLGGEAREALVAREIVTTGDWILPLWNGTVVPSKPPMFHWLVATAAHVAGDRVTAATLRAPSAVVASLIVVMVYAAGIAWGGDVVGTCAGLVLATTPQFLREAGNGRVDMTLLAGIVAAQIALAAAWRRGGARGLPGIALALALAWAMLAKGPVGPGVVGLTAVALAVTRRDGWTLLRLVRPLPVLLFVALAGGWYGLAYLHRGMPFVAKQILSENGDALLGGARIPYRSPLFFVVPLIVNGLPWTLLLPWAVAAGRRAAPERQHALVWAAVVFLFFSAAPLKRAAYILPLRPALALLIGWWIADRIRDATPAGRWAVAARAVAWIAGVAAVVVGVATGLLARGIVPATVRTLVASHGVDVEAVVRVAEAARTEALVLAITGVVVAWGTAWALGRSRWRLATGGAATLVALTALFSGDIVARERADQQSVRAFARAVAETVPTRERLSMVASSDVLPFLFYVDRHVPLERPAGGVLGAGWHVLHQPRWAKIRAESRCAEQQLHTAHTEDLVLVRCEGDGSEPPPPGVDDVDDTDG